VAEWAPARVLAAQGVRLALDAEGVDLSGRHGVRKFHDSKQADGEVEVEVVVD